MKRNSGFITDDRIITSTLAAKGIHDLHDVHIKRVATAWPRTPRFMSLTPSVTTVTEGNSMTFTLTTEHVEPNTTLYYTIATVSGTTMVDADFNISPNNGGVDGSFNTTNLLNQIFLNTVLTFGLVAELSPGDAESNVFKLQIRTGSTSGPVVIESSDITVTDATSTGIDTTIDLRVSSTPTGTTLTSSSLTTAWSTTYGFQTVGNATGFSYPLSLTDTYTGDMLFQATVDWPNNNCADPALAMWIASNGRNYPQWQWSGTNTTRVSFQMNCVSNPQLNTPSGNVTGSSLSSAVNNFVTLHLWHHQTAGVMRAKITLGQFDWGINGTAIGGTSTPLSKAYSTTSAVYFGIGSDYDGASIGSESTNFHKLRIRNSSTWVAP
tara:strand:- start:642 stop:1781 length:1140 start_codon:yes stop_codon:yes gene_type:complete